MVVESRGCRAAGYSRRHPEQIVLYRIVRQHLKAYLLLAREGDGDGDAPPAYVERDFRRDPPTISAPTNVVAPLPEASLRWSRGGNIAWGAVESPILG
jgi:hypothetical protein